MKLFLFLLAAIACLPAGAFAQGAARGTQTAALAEDSWKNQFKPKGGAIAQATPAPVKERVTYTLHRAEKPTDEELAAYERITAGMDKAIGFYNKYTSKVKKHIDVFYSPGTPTADGNINGSIRMGKSAHNERVSMHEICHTVGIGTAPQWGKLVVNGIFTGSHATQQLQEITGDKKAALHADRMHFWPYGLNFDTEVKSDQDLINHCKMVEAICEDLKETK